MALRDVLQSLNDTDLVAAQAASGLAGESVAASADFTDEAYDAPMMVISQINEA